MHCRRWAVVFNPLAAEAGLQCVSTVVLGWIGCFWSGGCATLWMIRMFTWGRRAATACAGNQSTSARYPVARERERGVSAFKAVVVSHASRRRVFAQRGIPTAHYSHPSLRESWFLVLSDRSTRARSRSRLGRTDGLGVTRAAKHLMRQLFRNPTLPYSYKTTTLVLDTVLTRERSSPQPLDTDTASLERRSPRSLRANTSRTCGRLVTP